MPTQQKIDRVQEIKDRLERSTIVMTTRYSGISVNQMTDLRRALRGGGVEFTIVKNTLLSLAADAAQKPQLKEIIEGPTAIALGYDDPVNAAKVVADYVRIGGSALAIIGAVMGGGAPMSADEVTKLASLPPKDQLLAMLLGRMQAPIAQLLTILNGPLQSLDNVLQARVRQMEEEGPASAAEAASVPETPAAETSEEPEATAEADDALPAGEAPAGEGPAAKTEEAFPDEPEGGDAPEGDTEAEPEAEAESE